MAGVSISMTGYNKRELEHAIRSLGLTPQQLTQANNRTLTAMGAWMFREMRSALESSGAQGQPGSNKKWPELSPDYEAYKQTMHKKRGVVSIGILTGKMQNSISTDIRRSRLEVETGPTVEHAEFFDKMRPLTPKEDYALTYMAEAMIDSLRKAAG